MVVVDDKILIDYLNVTCDALLMSSICELIL